MNLYQLKRVLLGFVYPNRCPFCGEIINTEKYFCPGCLELDPYRQELGKSKDVFYCVYNEKSKPIITKAKENADGCAVSALAKLLHTTLLESGILDKVDVITAIPARKESMKKRGYSFPALLAKEIAALSGKKFSKKMLKLLREPTEQKGLSAAEREENLKGTFGIGKDKPLGLKILVIDDVSTTGTTLNEAKRALSEYTENIYGAAFAKTVLD